MLPGAVPTEQSAANIVVQVRLLERPSDDL